MRHLLMIFVKLPDPGRVKTRLGEVVGYEVAAKIYRSLVARVVQRLRGIEGAAIWVVFDPAERKSEVMEWLEPEFGVGLVSYVPQAEGDLGERLRAAFVAGFAAGFEKVAVVGTDCVEVDLEGIRACWEMLSERAVVFGPADDGGYYLLGMSLPCLELFEQIPWSSERTLEVSQQAALECGRSVGLLPMLSDVDEIDQWQALCARDPSWCLE